MKTQVKAAIITILLFVVIVPVIYKYEIAGLLAVLILGLVITTWKLITMYLNDN